MSCEQNGPRPGEGNAAAITEPAHCNSADHKDEIAKYCDVVYNPDDIIEIRRLPCGNSTWHRARDLPGLADELQRDNTSGQNIYVGANPRTLFGGRKAEDVELARCIFADFDNASIDEVRERLKKSKLPPPALLVNSGHGVHAYWRLNNAVDPVSFTAAQTGLARLLGSDSKVKDPPRIMRLPGTLNVKESANPVPCYVVEADPAARLDLDALNTLIAKTNKSDVGSEADTKEQNTPTGEGRPPSQWTQNYIKHGTVEGNRNTSLFRAACDLHGRGWPLPNIRVALLPRAKKDGLDIGEADNAITSACSKTRTPIRDNEARAAIPTNEYLPIPVDAMPSPIASFVRETADVMGVDPAFIALPTLSMLGASIGTTRELELRPGWCEPPTIWTCTIARSGTMKSPAMDAAIKPLADAEHRAQLSNQAAQAEYEDRQLRYERDLSEWRKRKDDSAPPEKLATFARRRYILSDATLEALAPLLLENPRGLLLARDEMAGWARGFNQYKGGKGGDAAAWLELNRAGRLIVDRKTSGTIYVQRAAVSVCGTIQPSIFANVMRGEHFDSGLAARILVAQPPTRPKLFTTKAVSADTANAYSAVVADLLRLDHDHADDGPRPVRLRLSPDASAAWKTWFERHAVRQHEASEDSEAAALAKIEAYAARFALVFALVADPYAEVVDGDAIRRGCELADWFAHEAERVYGRLHDDEETQELRQLVEWINRKGGSVTAREVSRSLRAYPYATDAEKALDGLVQANLGTWSNPAPGKRGGRPTRTFVLHSTDVCAADETSDSESESDVSSASAVSAGIGNDAEWGEV